MRGLDNLPEFAGDEEIAAALVGARRAKEVAAMFPLFENEGFPRVDRRFGGRYVPAVKRFFDAEYGLSDNRPSQRNGGEDWTQWRKTKRRA